VACAYAAAGTGTPARSIVGDARQLDVVGDDEALQRRLRRFDRRGRAVQRDRLGLREHDEIRDRPALLAQQQRRTAGADAERLHVVRQHTLEEPDAIRSRHAHAREPRHVDEARAFGERAVLARAVVAHP
jgi:hypothetical protein